MPTLVDTGALELLRRRDRRIEALVLRHYPPVICAHVAGEFIFGQVRARVSSAAFQQACDFVETFEILQPGRATAMIYARLRAETTARGIQLPDPDYWIAAHALENRWPLVSTDRDFEHLPELTLHYVPPQPRS